MIENQNIERGKEAGKAYLVLSVRDLRKLLKQATAGAHADGRASRRGVGSHCLVLKSRLLQFGDDPDLQFSTPDMEVLGGAK